MSIPSLSTSLSTSSSDKSLTSFPNESTKTWSNGVESLWSKIVDHRLALSIACLVLASAILFVTTTYLPVSPRRVPVEHKVDKPLVLTLNQSLGSVDTQDITMSPRLEGEWSHQQGNILTGDHIVFTPTDSFTVNTTYTVTFPVANRVLGGQAEIKPISFKTEKAPGLAKQGLATLEDGATIAADYSFNAILSEANRGLRQLELRTTPELNLNPSVEDDTRFMWKSEELLPQGQTFTLDLYDTKNQTSLLTRELTVASEPVVNDLAKSSLIGATEPVKVTFSQSIDPQSTSFISVDTEGQSSWENDTTFVFTPKGLEPGKTHTITIKTGLRSSSGGILTTDQTKTFSSVGPVSVLSSSPHGNRLKQASQQVSFTFDQSVDRQSVENRLTISSGTVSKTSWEGNTFTATVINIGYQRTFAASLAAGIINTDFGLPSNQVFRLSFTTEVRTVRLNIPFYKQQHSGTCTVASLRMALAYKGISTDEMSIVHRMGYKPTTMDKSTDPPTWDDPQEMFVGSVDGKIREGTGAGPDAPPVAKAARSFGINAEAVTGINANWVAKQLHNGHPVIIFGAFGNKVEYIRWQTPAGKKIIMNLTSHARLVIGVQGEPDNPLGFWVSDPLVGTSYWSTATLSRDISMDPDRQAVAIR